MTLLIALLTTGLPGLVGCSAKSVGDSADTAGADTTDNGGGDDGGDDGGDGGTITITEDECDDLPTVTYNNFGKGFMTENCQGCHASTAPNRYEAPEDVIFDTVDDCWDRASRILDRCTGEDPTMPPQGGVSADDRTKLGWWRVCAEPGT